MKKQNTPRPAIRDPDHSAPNPITITIEGLAIDVFSTGNEDGDYNAVAIGNQNGIFFGPATPSLIPGLFFAAGQSAPRVKPAGIRIDHHAAGIGIADAGNKDGNGNSVIIGN